MNQPVLPDFTLSQRMSRMKASAVREILKVAERPDILSFAGGLPAPELFPIEAIARAHREVFAEEGEQALQYSTTEGYLPLRQWIAQRMRTRGIPAAVERLLITSGSQQGIDLVAKVLLDPGDAVAVENPCYLAALQAFGAYEVDFLHVGSDDEGMRVDELEAKIAQRRPKLIYLVPEFHNPKGTSLSLERRRRLLALASKHRIPILEDDPYGELRFRGELPPPLAALDTEGVVVYLSTFSKTLAPGLRIGWLHAPQQLFAAVTVAKQAADLHTATLTQRAAARLLETFDYEANLRALRKAYGERRDVMLDALSRHMPEGTRWTRPEGGLFVWVQLPKGMKSDELLVPALEQKVAFVPGMAFFAAEPKREFMRLNFSNRTPALIEEGMARLGKVIHAAARGAKKLH